MHGRAGLLGRHPGVASIHFLPVNFQLVLVHAPGGRLLPEARVPASVVADVRSAVSTRLEELLALADLFRLYMGDDDNTNHSQIVLHA